MSQTNVRFLHSIHFLIRAESAKTLTTTDAWQVLATKIDKRLKQLAPRDKDVLNAISVMTERFEQIKTHKELIAFLQSASTSALHPSSSSLSSGPVIQDGMTNVAIGPAALAVEPTMDVVMTPLAARRKQSRPKRSNNKRVANTPMCVVMHAESFDPASVPVKRLCGVAQHVDNSVSVTNTMPINIMPANLPCFSGAADYQTNHAAYLQTNGWDYL